MCIGDLCITEDIGLASTLLSKGVYVLSPRGILSEEVKSRQLSSFVLFSKTRKVQGLWKGPKPLSEKDRENFMEEFLKLLSNFQERN